MTQRFIDLFADLVGFNGLAMRSEFATSADVVMKASGLRFEAIRVIAREQGVNIEDSACRCIGEPLLALLAEAQVRRLKVYFNNALRHFADLGGDEMATFVDFCRTFKKRRTSNLYAQSWDDIDTDAIREHFIQKVHELTNSDLFEYSSEILLTSESVYEYFVNRRFRSFINNKKDNRDAILEQIRNSYLYHSRVVKRTTPCLDIRSVVRRVTLTARFHIFSSPEDHLITI